MSETKRDVLTYVLIVFLLLGALFGMQIMSFIFGTLNPDSLSSFTDVTKNVLNETGDINETASAYQLSKFSSIDFDGGFSIVIITNTSNGVVIEAANYTFDSATGVIINATSMIWSNVNISYSYPGKGEAQIQAERIQNDSLGAVLTYSSNSSTQFSTVSIAITLILLIGLFVIFWKLIMKDGVIGGSGSKGSGNFS